MSEEKIQLPPFLIADLYKGYLVELDTFKAEENLSSPKEVVPDQVITEERSETIKHLGENRKNVIIIVNQPGTAFLKEDDLTFLTNILKACQLTITDIAIVNIAETLVDYTALKEQLNPAYILLFDVKSSAIKLPFTIPVFQVQKYAVCTIMVAPALSKINKATADGKLLKTKLWVGLKQVFNI